MSKTIPLPDGVERRAFSLAEFRVKASDDQKPRTIEGYPAVFNKDSENMGFIERIAPGAFGDAIAKDDVRALFNHDPNFVLGRNRAKTLALSEDETGLFMDVAPPDTQWARDLLVSIDRGDVTQGSFGFRILPDGDEWDVDKNGTLIRTLKKVRLFDVSVVTYPAYQDTEIDARSAERMLAEGKRRLEARSAQQPTIGVGIAEKMLAHRLRA